MIKNKIIGQSGRLANWTLGFWLGIALV